MPSAHRDGPYRFLFYSFLFYSQDRAEPPHVHVQRDRDEAKFWLDPVRLARNRGFSRSELNRIERLVVQHRQLLIEAWDDHFNP